MNIRKLFPTPLIEVDLDFDGDFSAALRALILEQEACSAGVRFSNDGGWQSEHDFVIWGGPLAGLLIEAARSIVDRCTVRMQDGSVARQAPDWRIRAWANVGRRAAANHAHFHPGAFWSAVFYVDDGGIHADPGLGGLLEFADPRGIAPLMYVPTVKIGIPACLSAGLVERIVPRAGRLVVFPAWLGHAVTRYDGDGVRVSVAMNFSV